MSRTTTTVGELTANAIGRDRITIHHEGSTVSGLLTNLDITADIITDATLHDPHRVIIADVRVAITLGSITLRGLRREHPCKAISAAPAEPADAEALADCGDEA